MKKAALFLLVIFCSCVPARAQYTQTTNLGLKKPNHAVTSWDPYINGNLDSLDGLLGGVETLAANSATPSIAGGAGWLTQNTSATAIANFSGGFPGQHIRVICGDALTTISSGLNISANSPFDCATGMSISFVLSGSVWVETGRATGNGTFKGPNPHIDITAYGARAIQTNSPIKGTVTCTSGNQVVTTTTVLALRIGDGARLDGCGATNAAVPPTGLSVVASMDLGAQNSGLTVPAGTGSASYTYSVFPINANGGITGASTPVTITNGQATLGSQTINITSSSRSNDIVTVTTATPHNLPVGCSTCPRVHTANGSDPSFSGEFLLSSVPDNMHFSYQGGMDTRYGAATSSTGGTVTYNASNHLTWTAPASGTPYQYGICSGTTIINMSRPGETEYDDYGIVNGKLPDFLPATCPSSSTNDYLETTILSGAGTTALTVANAPANSNSGATDKIIEFDDGPTIANTVTAALAARGVVYIPTTPVGYSFPINSHQKWAGVNLLLAGALLVNSTIEGGQEFHLNGNILGGSNCNFPQFGWGCGQPITIGTAYPGFAIDPALSVVSGIAFSAGDNGLVMTLTPHDFNFIFRDSSCNVGSGNGTDYVGACLITYATVGINVQNVLFKSSGANSIAAMTPLFWMRDSIDGSTHSGHLKCMFCFFNQRGVSTEGKAEFSFGYAENLKGPFITLDHLNSPYLSVMDVQNDTATGPMVANYNSNNPDIFIMQVSRNSFETGGQTNLVSGNPITFSASAGRGTLTVISGSNLIGQNHDFIQIVGGAVTTGSLSVAGGHINSTSTGNKDFSGTGTCSGGTATVSFFNAFISTPSIVVSDETTAGGARVSTKSNSGFTVTCSGASDAFDYIVVGNPN